MPLLREMVPVESLPFIGRCAVRRLFLVILSLNGVPYSQLGENFTSCTSLLTMIGDFNVSPRELCISTLFDCT